MTSLKVVYHCLKETQFEWLNLHFSLSAEKRRQEQGPTRVGRKKKKKGVAEYNKLPNSK